MATNKQKQDAFSEQAPAEETPAANVSEESVETNSVAPAVFEDAVSGNSFPKYKAPPPPPPPVETHAEEVAETVIEEGHFICEGKKYRIRLPKVHIPGIGERTALELAVDEEAQEWLIKNNCVGSVIEEVI